MFLPVARRVPMTRQRLSVFVCAGHCTKRSSTISRVLSSAFASSLASSPSTGSAASATAPAGATAHGAQHPYVSHVYRVLSQNAPCFPVDPQQVEIIRTPSAFYEELLSLTSTCTKRLYLSALYIGTDNKEKILMEKIHHQYKSVDSLCNVRFLVDFNRASRKDKMDANSLDLLMKIIKTPKASLSSAKLSLVRCPELDLTKTSLRARFFRYIHENLVTPQLTGRAKELFSTHHMKVYIFDDNVIISGANLSDLYFTQRQDRYILIRNNKPLADFYQAMLDILGDDTSISCTIDDLSCQTAEAKLLEHREKSFTSCTNLQERLRILLASSETSSLPPFPSPPSSSLHPLPTGSQCVVFPTVQFGSAGIVHDNRTLFQLLRSLPSLPPSDKVSLDFATGYLNLTDKLLQILANACRQGHRIAVSTASEEANGWFGAHSVFKYIPGMYSAILLNAMKFVKKEGCTDEKKFRFFEYQRKGWSYHGKGLWLSLLEKSGTDAVRAPSSTDESSLPFFTIIGSSNFGYRSSERDTESQLYILTTDAMLQRRLGKERDDILSFCHQVSKDSVQRNVNVLHQCLARCFSRFL